eukprot:s5700_g2.t1
MNTTAFDVESLSPGYPPDSPPVPRFFKSKESKVVKAVKREETLESVSQGSTAASRGFFAANYSNDEHSEPDLSLNTLSSRGPPGLYSGREIFRRLQELETLKAALSQLEAEERTAIAQATARPDPALMARMPASMLNSHAMLRAPEPSGLGRSWPPAAPLSHSQSFQPSLLSTVATSSFQDLQIPSLLGPSLSGAVPGTQAFVSGRADPDPAPISPTGPATHRKQARAEFAVQKHINQELLAASATEDEGCALQVLASYEMTNIMWAFGELCKSRRQLSKDLKEDLRNFLEATCSVFITRPSGWKLQVLMSALVSLTILPWQPCSQRLFTDIARELAGRQQELANEKTKPLVMAFHELRTKKPQAFKEIMMTLQDFPDFVAHPSLRGQCT